MKLRAAAAPVPALSIIVPTLDEAAGIAATLDALAPLRARGCEVVVVDGGSRDGTAALAAPRADRVVMSLPGRARQMNAGAAAARSARLLFLHADTWLPGQADERVRAALDRAPSPGAASTSASKDDRRCCVWSLR